MREKDYCNVEDVINNIAEGFEEEDVNSITEMMINENKDSKWYYPENSKFLFNETMLEKSKALLESYISEEATKILPEMREALKNQKTKGDVRGKDEDVSLNFYVGS